MCYTCSMRQAIWASVFKYYMWIQITLGILLGILNFALYCLQSFNILPLYMDSVFVVCASFFGGICGFVSATVHHLLCIFINGADAFSFIWALCSYTIVGVIRMYVRKAKIISALDIVFIVFIIVLIVSVEGALIFMALRSVSNFQEDSQVKPMYLLLAKIGIPAFFSALLPRVPVNILDKGICVSLGYLSYIGLAKVLTRLINR